MLAELASCGLVEDQLTIRYLCCGSLNAETRCAELFCASAMVALLCSVASSLFLLRAFLVSAHSRLCTPFSLSPREKAAPHQRKPPPTRGERGGENSTAQKGREKIAPPKRRERETAPRRRVEKSAPHTSLCSLFLFLFFLLFGSGWGSKVENGEKPTGST